MKFFKRLHILALALMISVAALTPAVPVSAASFHIVRSGNSVNYSGTKIVKFTYNKTNYALTETPGLLLDKYVMVPYYQTYVANGPKLEKSYDSEKGKLTLKSKDTTVVFTVDSTTVMVNGKKNTIPVAPCFLTYPNDTTALMIPAKATSDFFDLAYLYTSSDPSVAYGTDVTLPDGRYLRYTTGTAVNVRKGASSSSDKIESLSRNTQVTCYGTKNSYTKIKRNGSYCYVSTQYLNNQKVYYRYVNINSLKIRKTATSDAKAAGYYKLGKKVLCYGKEDIYTKIKYDGNVCYLKTDCLTATEPLQAKSFNGMTTSEYIKAMGPIAQKDYKTSGVLASVTIAQSIQESGWGKSTLAENANNMFGMKENLSGNTWSGSVWTGEIYTKRTAEYRSDGTKYYIDANFRKYNGVGASVADHSAYLKNAMNGSKKRYAGLTDTTSYTEQLKIIKNGGYATDPDYVSSLSNLIEKYDLTKYDVK